MKKFLACLLVLSLLSGIAFAAPAVKAAPAPAQTGTKLDITTVTKEFSEAQFPGVLVPGSLFGTSVFVSDYARLPNVALFEYIYGNTFGVITMATDFGKLGLSISPAPYADLWDISVNTPSNVIGLQWGKKIGDMPVGVSLLYGTDNETWQNLDLPSNSWTVADTTNSDSQYVAVRLGANVSGMDLSLGVALNTYTETNESWQDSSTWAWWENYNDSKLMIDLAARMDLGSGLTGFAALSWLTGSEKYYLRDWNPQDYLEEYYNGKLSFQGYIGKDIQAGENLLIKLALGLTIGGDVDAKYRYTDYLDYSSNYTGYYSQDSESTFEIPLNVAVEGRLNETWSFNTGVSAILFGLYGNKDAANTNYYGESIRIFEEGNELNIDPGLSYAIGVTGVIGDLRLDMFLNPVILLVGPYFLNGNNTPGWLNAGVAFAYLW